MHNSMDQRVTQTAAYIRLQDIHNIINVTKYTSHLIMCTVGSICIIFDFTNKTFLLNNIMDQSVTQTAVYIRVQYIHNIMDQRVTRKASDIRQQYTQMH